MNFLKRWFGRQAEPVEPPPEFVGENPPDWLVDLKGRDAAGGGAFSLRVQIHLPGRKGTAELLVVPPAQGGEPKSVTSELQRGEIDRMLVILGFSFPQDFASVEGEAADRERITVHRREPFGEAVAECGLAEWMESRASGPPVVELGRVLMEVRKRMLNAKC